MPQLNECTKWQERISKESDAFKNKVESEPTSGSEPYPRFVMMSAVKKSQREARVISEDDKIAVVEFEEPNTSSPTKLEEAQAVIAAQVEKITALNVEIAALKQRLELNEQRKRKKTSSAGGPSN